MLVFTAPAITRRALNPAQTFVTGRSFEMGITIPTYNGTPCTDLQGHHVAQPTVEVRRNGNVSLKQTTYRSAARITNIPAHTIHSPIVLPPFPINGAWIVGNVPGNMIKDLLTEICNRRRRDGQTVNNHFDPQKNQRLITLGNRYSLVIRLLPDADRFMRHIEFHEYQHISDHRWLAKQIIGRWDDWLRGAMGKIIVSKMSSGADIGAIASGYEYSIGAQRIIMYWARVAAYSGDLYHETDEGASAILNIVSVNDKTVTVSMRPKRIIHTRPDINNPEPHRSMAVKARNIDGTEIDIAYGEPEIFPLSKWVSIESRYYTR
ncbi:hypothetical protein [Teredinibacter turnerae]|uniref:hypothetical protein n=1 Tax=Teredinibacter turnerae TaxID=2426 RepID=UPI0030D1512B